MFYLSTSTKSQVDRTVQVLQGNVDSADVDIVRVLGTVGRAAGVTGEPRDVMVHNGLPPHLVVLVHLLHLVLQLLEESPGVSAISTGSCGPPQVMVTRRLTTRLVSLPSTMAVVLL